jgi:hypothetical protein
MTEWKRNRLLRVKKMAALKANRESKDGNYIRNIFKKIKDKIVKIIGKLRK